jgi:hypothetical protein
LDVVDADGVDADVDVARLRDDRVEVGVYLVRSQCVDLAGEGGAARVRDVVDDDDEGASVRPARKTVAPSRANVRASAPPTAAAAP